MRTRLHGQLPDLHHGAQVALRRRVQHDGEGAGDAQHAAQHAKKVEALVEDVVRKHGAAWEG